MKNGCGEESTFGTERVASKEQAQGKHCHILKPTLRQRLYSFVAEIEIYVLGV
jgi:hypothetical protein